MATFLIGLLAVGIVGFSATYIFLMNRELHKK
jgi:hypothetical protein